MKFRTITVLLAASALTVGLAVSTAGPASAACGPVGCQCATGTCIWAGYGLAARGASFSSVSGEFAVPAIKGSDGEVAIWVGLGGRAYVGDPLEQTGVVGMIVNGKPVYKGVWEVLYNGSCITSCPPQDQPHYFAQTVKPGNEMAASVTYSVDSAGVGTYWLFLRDVTQGWTENVPVTANGDNGATSNDGAEAILEDVGAGPLPDFGTVLIDNVTIDGGYGWTQQNPIEYTLGTGKVYISPPQPSGDFTVTWEHS